MPVNEFCPRCKKVWASYVRATFFDEPTDEVIVEEAECPRCQSKPKRSRRSKQKTTPEGDDRTLALPFPD